MRNAPEVPWQADFLPHGLKVVGGEPLVHHCHHYNTVLQQSIEDAASSVPAVRILKDGAAIPAHAQFRAFGAGQPPAQCLHLGAAYFRRAGFGLLDLSALGSNGGVVWLHNSHYALGFRSRAGGPLARPVCHFAAGFCEGLLAAAHDLPPGAFTANETHCAATGDGPCRIELRRSAEMRPLPATAGVGLLVEPLPARPAQPATLVDEAAIVAGVRTLLTGGNEEGLMPGFGVYLTEHYANYYNHVSYELERQLAAAAPHLGGAAQELLVEAGHVCGFHTFGGIMSSPEWDAVVRPMLRERADWIFGIVAVVNALGWGRWTVTELVESRSLTVQIDCGYESNYYCKVHGIGTEGRCYLAQGGVAALMNLLYVGDITARPELTQERYRELFSRPGTFRATELRCRAKGDPHCQIVAERRDRA